jgi:hypothetical protein
LLGDRDGQAGLTHTTKTYESDKAVIAYPSDHVLHCGPTADQW